MSDLLYEKHPAREDKIPFYMGTYTQKTCIANWHSNIEILMFLNGKATVFCDGERFLINPYEIFIVNSNCIHHIQSEDENTYTVMIIDENFCTENGVDIKKLIFRSIVQDKAAVEKFLKIKASYDDQMLPFRIPVTRARTLNFLTYILNNHLIGEKDDNKKTNKIFKSAIGYIDENFRRYITLDEIAAQCCINKSYLSREFKKTSGITVFEYITTLRCKEAHYLITNGISVGTAAQNCGFENMSYFARTYKKIVGELPSQTKLRNK